MRSRPLSVAAAAALCAGLVSCASYEKPLAPALFPPQAAAVAKDPASVALELTDRDQRYRSRRQSGYLFDVTLPIGHIVEAAGLLAFGAEFDHVATTTAGSDPRALRVRVDSITTSVNSKVVYFIPLGPIPLDRVDLKTRLALRVEALAPDGTVRWSQALDSGDELVVPRRRGIAPVETPHDAVQRAIHEQAARLMRQAARDLRAWLEQERRRERVL